MFRACSGLWEIGIRNLIDFSSNEDQSLIRDMARDFAARELAPHAAELDESGRFPEDGLRKAAQMGLLGINVPERLGGAESGVVAYSLAITELARACAATTVAVCVSNMVAEVLVAFGTQRQRELHVPRLCSGAYIVGGFALSEAGAGSDPGSMTTRATKVEGGWRIDGSKLWITSGSHAGLFVVWARTSDERGARGLTAFLVPGDTPGLTRGPAEKKLGQRGSPTTSLEFDDLRLGDDAVLGEVGHGFRVAMMALDGGRIGIASLALGVAEAAAAVAVDYARERKQFGKAIAQFQAIQWMLADNAVDLDVSRLLVAKAAQLKESGQAFSIEAARAKLMASERGFLVCNRSLQVLGGCGYTRDYPVERYLRDIRVTSIYEGTSEIQRVVIGRALAD